MGKIILTLLAIAVCTEATFNVGSLLSLLTPPAPRVVHPAPVPVYPAAPVQPGYASYYRQAPQVVQVVPQARVVNQPVVQAAPAPVVFVQKAAPAASFYRQPAAAAPAFTSVVVPPAVQSTSAVVSTSFTGQQEPLTFTRFGSEEPLSFTSFGSKEPLSFSSFGSKEPLSFTSFGSQQPISFTEFTKPELPEPAISIVPSQSLSFSFADSSASSGAGYSVETVKSEGHSYSLAPEQITVEKTIAPVTTIETVEQYHEHIPEAPLVNLQELSLRGSEEPLDVKAVAGASATVEVDGKAVEEPTRVVLQTEAAAEEPKAEAAPEEPKVEVAQEPVALPAVAEVPEVAEVAEVSVQSTASRFQAEEQQAQQQPQAIAAVQLNQAEITEQILKQAIPNVVSQVSPHIIQQAIPLVVDRAVPQVVYQVGSTVAQQAHKQSEPVQIVTPLNTHQHQQKQNEKVFVMYATSAPKNQQYENVFQNNQYDVSDNLVVPIGNRFQQQAQQQQKQSQFTITRGIQAGTDTQEQRQNTAYFNQQIVSNFQRENALLRQQQQNGAFAQQQNGGQGATFEQIQQNYPGLLSRNKRKQDA